MADDEQDLSIPESERGAIEARLRALHNLHDGLTAGIVLEDARAKSSPLHARVFSLDEKAAAYQHYLSVCRQIIRQFEYVLVDQDPPRRVSVFTYSPVDTKYRLTDQIMQSDEQLRAAARRIYSQIASLYARNQALLDLYQSMGPVKRALTEARDHLDLLQQSPPQA